MRLALALMLLGSLQAHAGLDNESHNWGWGNCLAKANICVEVKINCDSGEPVATSLKPQDRRMGVVIRIGREIAGYWNPYDDRPSVTEAISYKPGFAVGKGGYDIYLENQSVYIVHPSGELINLGEITLQGLKCGERYNGHDSVAVELNQNPETEFAVNDSSELMISSGSLSPVYIPEWKY